MEENVAAATIAREGAGPPLSFMRPCSKIKCGHASSYSQQNAQLHMSETFCRTCGLHSFYGEILKFLPVQSYNTRGIENIRKL